MATEPTPYINRNPGDLVTAEDWDNVQVEIKKDIAAKVQAGVESVKSVKNAEDAGKLGGKTPEELTQDIINRVTQVLPTKTGYRQLFKRLTVNEEEVIKHGLGVCPLVDVYQLDYFKVVCAEDENVKREAWVNFYLYHTSEKRIRLTAGGATTTIEIEPISGQAFKIPFAEMLNRYHVPYTDTSSLDDLETEFWKALFNDPNDRFEPEQFCHSPWFEKCCGEKRTVKELKDTGAWDDLWFKMYPRKTINYLAGATMPPAGGTPTPAVPPTAAPPALPAPTPAPTQIQVVHFDFDTLGIKVILDPVYPAVLVPAGDQSALINKKELKVMLLLKV